MTTDVEIHVTERSQSKPTWHMIISDFANMVKAFIGSNYLSIAFAFSQSGLVPGIIFLLGIAIVTNHCCHLIIKCKYAAIDHVLAMQGMPDDNKKTNSSYSREEMSADEDEERQKMKKQLIRGMTYGDIGKIVYGKWGLFVVNACLIFTQFGFCINYFIFVGNTVYTLFPKGNETVHGSGMDIPTSPQPGFRSSEFPPLNLSSNVLERAVYDMFSGSYGNDSNITTTTAAPFTNSTSVIPVIDLYQIVSQAPDLRLLVLTPLPIFVAFALLRHVRHLGMVSVGADISIFAGCVVTMGYIVYEYSPSPTWHMFEWTTLPIFFGLVTSSYEGIGTIIPIESSMEGNRHNFGKFLNGSLCIITTVLASFGIVGYLSYGNATDQMLNKNLPSDTYLSFSINICLMIGVILTFPLQVYPVIELAEIYLMGDGRICGPKKQKYNLLTGDGEGESVEDESDGRDKERLIPKEKVDMPTPVAVTVSDEVSTWSRNFLRMIIVIVAAGLAVLLRNLYAYVGSIIGALGSSVLAYILPCLFHLNLRWSDLSMGVKVKDITIVILGVLLSIVSFYYTIMEIVNKS